LRDLLSNHVRNRISLDALTVLRRFWEDKLLCPSRPLRFEMLHSRVEIEKQHFREESSRKRAEGYTYKCMRICKRQGSKISDRRNGSQSGSVAPSQRRLDLGTSWTRLNYSSSRVQVSSIKKFAIAF
jgi:hypothetical protein